MGRITAVAACAAAAFVLSSPPQGRVQLVDDQQQDPNAAPRINAPAGQPQHEQDQYDLLDQFQDGQGPTFGGDPRKCTPDGLMVNIPRSPASERAPGPPGTRVLPTGTALGPNGHRYAFFSHPNNAGPAAGDSPWVSNGSVWDFTGPAHPFKVGDLPGIYQASGVYDSATTQMFIIGNGSGQEGDLTRGLWVSRPINPSNPNGWISNLQRVGDVSLPGNRESQLVALQGGGFMFVGATDNGPVSAITAATPQGLINATPQTLIETNTLPTVYGPTVTGLSLDPATGLETVNLRVSTWQNEHIYDPNTWTTGVTVQH